MRSIDAIKVLHRCDRQGRYLFGTRALAIVFGERGSKLRATVNRLVSDEILERVTRGLYAYALSGHIGPNTIYDVAGALRLGEYVYESYESAASKWGFVSQIPVDCLTVATTGRPGRVPTSYGTIEFEQVNRSATEILAQTVDRQPGVPMRLASERCALEDMLSAEGRCVELIDWEVVEEDLGEQIRL